MLPTRNPPAAPTTLAINLFGAVHPLVIAVFKISTRSRSALFRNLQTIIANPPAKATDSRRYDQFFVADSGCYHERCNNGAAHSGRPAHQLPCQPIVPLDEDRQVEGRKPAVPDDDTPIDDAERHFAR